MTESLVLHRPPVPAVLQPFVDPQGRLIQMPRREQRRIEALRWVAASLPGPAEISEVEVNALLRQFHDDVAMLRRYLVDYGLIERPSPGRYAWGHPVQPQVKDVT